MAIAKADGTRRNGSTLGVPNKSSYRAGTRLRRFGRVGCGCSISPMQPWQSHTSTRLPKIYFWHSETLWHRQHTSSD